jgi:chemotaxis protein CheC
MKIDIQTLGTFNQLAREGAQQAATSLEQLAGIEPTVEATTIDLATKHDVISDLEGRTLVGVMSELSNTLKGQALLVFDKAGTQTLAKNLPGGDPTSEEKIHARVQEVGNILISGFIDGWADHLDTIIDVSPPTIVTGSGVDALSQGTTVSDSSEQVLSFTTLLETTSAAVNASIYLFPEQDSFERIVADQLSDESAPIPLDRLEVFNRMTRMGTEQASENVTMMTGIETTVEVSRLSFLPIEQADSKLGDDPYIGVVVTLDSLNGYLLILFDEVSAGALAEQLGAGSDDDEFGGMHQSAIEEVGNIMTSGFIDGWANVLETSITHSPPEFVHDYAPAILDPVTASLATQQQYAFVFDSLIQTTDETVSCEIFALPDENEFKRVLSNLELNTETATDDDALAATMEVDPDDLF